MIVTTFIIFMFDTGHLKGMNKQRPGNKLINIIIQSFVIESNQVINFFQKFSSLIDFKQLRMTKDHGYSAR